MDRPKRQTATATPAKPGGLPLTLEYARQGDPSRGCRLLRVAPGFRRRASCIGDASQISLSHMPVLTCTRTQSHWRFAEAGVRSDPDECGSERADCCESSDRLVRSFLLGFTHYKRGARKSHRGCGRPPRVLAAMSHFQNCRSERRGVSLRGDRFFLSLMRPLAARSHVTAFGFCTRKSASPIRVHAC